MNKTKRDMAEGADKEKGLTVRQQRAALEMLQELAAGERNVVVFRVTKSGDLQECVTETFVKAGAPTDY